MESSFPHNQAGLRISWKDCCPIFMAKICWKTNQDCWNFGRMTVDFIKAFSAALTPIVDIYFLTIHRDLSKPVKLCLFCSFKSLLILSILRSYWGCCIRQKTYLPKLTGIKFFLSKASVLNYIIYWWSMKNWNIFCFSHPCLFRRIWVTWTNFNPRNGPMLALNSMLVWQDLVANLGKSVAVL